jgi:hypothetical protein
MALNVLIQVPQDHIAAAPFTIQPYSRVGREEKREYKESRYRALPLWLALDPTYI